MTEQERFTALRAHGYDTNPSSWKDSKSERANVEALVKEGLMEKLKTPGGQAYFRTVAGNKAKAEFQCKDCYLYHLLGCPAHARNYEPQDNCHKWRREPNEKR